MVGVFTRRKTYLTTHTRHSPSTALASVASTLVSLDFVDTRYHQHHTSRDLGKSINCIMGEDLQETGSLCDIATVVETDQDAAAQYLNQGIVKRISDVAQSNSTTAEELKDLGRVAFALIKHKELRQQFIEEGGLIALRSSLGKLMPEGGSAYLPGYHAYARLFSKWIVAPCQYQPLLLTNAVTTPPAKLFSKSFPPAPSILEPLFLLLLSPESSKQQQYEALMALANMATVAPSMGSLISSASMTLQGDDTATRVMARIEQLLWSSDKLQVRAASQLVCNLTSSKAGWYYWTGETRHFDFPGESDTPTPQSSTPDGRLDPAAGARLGIVLLNARHQEAAIRLSSVAILAIVTQSPNACSALLQLKIVTKTGQAAEAAEQLWKSMVELFTQTEDRNLKIRSAVVVKNILRYIERFYEPQKTEELVKARKHGLTSAIQAEMEQVTNQDLVETLQEACRVL